MQPSFWKDYYYDPETPNMPGVLGIECNDKSLTFDGHFVCIIPTKSDQEANSIADALIAMLEGRKQAKRTKAGYHG
jgi:hypothetical protein